MRRVLLTVSALSIVAGTWLFVFAASDWSYSGGLAGIPSVMAPPHAGYTDSARYEMAAGAVLIIGGVILRRAK